MTGNGKSGRGLFSSIRRAAVATATAFSLAIGGMTAPAVSDHVADVALPSAEALTVNDLTIQQKRLRDGGQYKVGWDLFYSQTSADSVPISGIFTITPKLDAGQQLVPIDRVRVRIKRGDTVKQDLGEFAFRITNGSSYELDLSSKCPASSPCYLDRADLDRLSIESVNGVDRKFYGAFDQGTVQGGFVHREAPEAPKPGRVVGKVTVPEGYEPSRVELKINGQRVTVGADGRFTSPELQAGTYRWEAKLDSDNTDVQSNYVSVKAGETADLNIAIGERQGKATIYVQDRYGDPLRDWGGSFHIKRTDITPGSEETLPYDGWDNKSLTRSAGKYEIRYGGSDKYFPTAPQTFNVPGDGSSAVTLILHRKEVNGNVTLPKGDGQFKVEQGLTLKVYQNNTPVRTVDLTGSEPLNDSVPFQVEGLNNGTYRFELSGDYINTVEQSVVVNNHALFGVNFSPTLKTASAKVEVIVPSNENFDGGKIRITYKDRYGREQTKDVNYADYNRSAGEDLGVISPGNVSVELFDRDGKAVGTGHGYVLPGESKTISVSASKTLASYEGLVKDPFGNPISGVTVEVTGMGEDKKSGVTDSSGRYLIGGVRPAMEIGVKVAETRYTSELTEKVPANSDEGGKVYDIPDLTPDFKTRPLRLQFLADGAGVEGIQWAVTPDPNHKVKGAEPRSGVTDQTGYVDQVLYPGTYTLTVTSPKGDVGDKYTFENAPKTITIDSRSDMPVRVVKLKKNPGVLTGRVLNDANKPVANALVRAGLETARTNSDGYYTINRVEAGTTSVTVDKADDGSYDKASKSFNALEAAQKKSVDDITVQRATSRIEGTVTIDGKPATAGISVRAKAVDGNNAYDSPVGVDANGKFSFANTNEHKLLPGEYEIIIEDASDKRFSGARENVTVKVGEPAEVNLDLKENRAPITATVRNEAGEPVSGAKLSIDGVETTWTEGANGVYKSGNLPAGDYMVRVASSKEHGPSQGTVNVKWADGGDVLFTVTRVNGTITINVTDDEGQPVSGVTATLEGKKSDQDQTLVVRPVTVTNGTVTFTDVAVGSYKVTIEDSPVYDAVQPIEFQVGAAESLSRDVELRRKDASMTVHVMDEKSRAISSPSITLTDQNGTETKATGDADGKYEFNGLRPGTYKVEVAPTDRHKGGVTSGVILAPGSTAATNKVFVRVANESVTVTGTVVDENGSPVAGAIVRATSEGTQEFTTGKDGRFVFEGLQEGNVAFEVSKKIGEYTGNILNVNGLKPGDSRDIKIEVTRDLKRLNGSVIDDGGNAISGVEAQLMQDGNVVGTQTTDEVGSFAFEKMEPGTYTVKVNETDTHLGGESASFDVVLGQGTDPVQVTVQRKPGSLNGKVEFSNNKVVEGAAIRLVPQSGDPIDLDFDEAGNISVAELPAGTYKVEVNSPDNYKRVSVPPLTVYPGQQADLGVIKFTAEIGDVVGSVRDASGAPVGKVKVTLNRAGQQPIETWSADDGTFSFTKVSVGEYTVDVAQPEKFSPITGLKTTVNPAEESTLDITLEAKQTTGTVKGKVVDDAGNPVANVGISLEPTSGDGATIDLKVAEDGTFENSKIPAGSYSLWVTQPVGYEPVSNIPLRVDAGQLREVGTITLTKSAEQAETGNFIGGVYDKATGAPLPQTGLVLVGAAGRYPVAINADGTFRRNGIPSGEYQLKIVQPEGYLKPAAINVVIETGTDNYAQDIKLERVPVENTPTTGALQGTVLGLNEGHPVDPISGAKVNILRLGGGSTQVTTNTSGIFTAAGLEPGEYVVQVEAPEGYNTPRYARVFVEAGKTNEDLSIYLSRKPTPNPKPGAASGTISGWLLDDGNYAIKGGTMRITGTAKNKDGSPRVGEDGKVIQTLPAVRIGKDGYFTTDRLEPGEYTVDIDLPEGWPKPKGWPKKITVTEDKAVEFGVINVKAPRSEVKGVVDDGSGNPVKGVIVTATDSRGVTTAVKTDKDGKFVFDKALPGTTTIEVFTPQGIQNVDPMYVPIKPGEDVAVPGVHLTEKQLKLSKRIRGYDADDMDNAPILPEDWDLVYGFLITNETDEVITDITLDDPFLDMSKLVVPDDFKGSLAPGEHVFFSAVMPPQKGMSVVNNIATVHGKNSQGKMVASTPDNAVARIGSASVEKKVNARFGTSRNKPVSLDVDEDMYFTYEIMNRGSAPMYNVTLTDEVCEWNESKEEADPDNCKPMEIDLPNDWNRTLLPGERVFLSAVLPPLKPGTRHHNKALVKADLDQPRRSPGIEEEGAFEEDPPSILTVTPNKNSWGNAHVIVSEGKTLAGHITGTITGLPANEVAQTKVELISEDNKISLSGAVDGNGKFAYKNVAPGKYKLRVTNPSDSVMRIGGELGIPSEQAAKGEKLTTKLFDVAAEKTSDVTVQFQKVETQQGGSSLGRCVTETSSATNPAMYLIPIGLLVGAMAGSLVIYEDQFNAVVKQFNQAMPQLAIERPEWMNQISRQLEQMHPAAGPAVLGVILVAVGAIAIGLAYAACESGVDGSSKGGSSSKKDETPAKEPEKVS